MPYAIRPLSCLSVLSCPVCNVGALWPNGWMDQDKTWHAGRPRPLTHCVTRGPSSPLPKGHSPPIFGPYMLWPKGCMDQDPTWYEGRHRPRRLCVRWGPRCPSPKGGGAPKFSAHVYCDQTAVCIRIPLGTDVDLSLGDIVLHGDPAALS